MTGRVNRIREIDSGLPFMKGGVMETCKSGQWLTYQTKCLAAHFDEVLLLHWFTALLRLGKCSFQVL